MVEEVNEWRIKDTDSDQLVNDQLGLSRLQTRSDAFGLGRSEFDSEVHLFRLYRNICSVKIHFVQLATTYLFQVILTSLSLDTARQDQGSGTEVYILPIGSPSPVPGFTVGNTRLGCSSLITYWHKLTWKLVLTLRVYISEERT